MYEYVSKTVFSKNILSMLIFSCSLVKSHQFLPKHKCYKSMKSKSQQTFISFYKKIWIYSRLRLWLLLFIALKTSTWNLGFFLKKKLGSRVRISRKGNMWKCAKCFIEIKHFKWENSGGISNVKKQLGFLKGQKHRSHLSHLCLDQQSYAQIVEFLPESVRLGALEPHEDCISTHFWLRGCVINNVQSVSQVLKCTWN